MDATPKEKGSPGPLNIIAQCRSYHLPLWQCPQILFVVMGIVTIIAMVGIYFLGLAESYDPYAVSLISIFLAAFFLIQMFVIMQALERIADANRVQVDFINIAIHQLRSPVTAARWAMDRITSEATSGLSTETLQELYIVRDSVNKMANLVSSILGIVRIEAGTVAERKETFSLSEMANNLVEATKWYAHAANLELVADIPKEDIPVHADSEQVHYVMDHLLDNAMRYSKGAGRITLRLARENNKVKVSVNDAGVGIPDREQKEVFEKFFRASNASALEPGGAGLSLFVARTIVEAFGGEIGFNSEVGEGSTFWFTLPIAKKAESKKEPEEREADPEKGKV